MKRLQTRGALKAAINTHPLPPIEHCGNLGRFKPVTTRHPPDRLNRRLSAPHTPQLGLRTRPHRASSRGCFLFNIPWKCEAQIRPAPKVNVYGLPPAGAPGSTVRVEVLRLPPLTLFALDDNQSSASARTHLLGNESKSLKTKLESEALRMIHDSFYRSSGAAHGHRLLRFMASCSRSGHGHTRGRARGPRPHKTGSPRPPLRRPRARAPRTQRTRAHVSRPPGARGARGRGAEPSLPPLRRWGVVSAGGPRRNSLRCGLGHVAATGMHVGPRRAGGTDRPAGATDRPVPPAARAGRVTHALSHPTDHTDPSLAHVVAM
jgi:hypothetical protein